MRGTEYHPFLHSRRHSYHLKVERGTAVVAIEVSRGVHRCNHVCALAALRVFIILWRFDRYHRLHSAEGCPWHVWGWLSISATDSRKPLVLTWWEKIQPAMPWNLGHWPTPFKSKRSRFHCPRRVRQWDSAFSRLKFFKQATVFERQGGMKLHSKKILDSSRLADDGHLRYLGKSGVQRTPFWDS